MLVIDASVAVKFLAKEPGQSEALARIRSEPTLVAPDWILIEVGHALWRKAKAGELLQSDIDEGMAALPRFFETLEGSAQQLPAAMRLAVEIDHWVYDCIYLATAMAVGGRLLTADRKFWNAARRSGHGDHVELLTWAGGEQ